MHIHTCIHVTTNNEKSMNLNMSREGCMGGFGERKEKEEIM